MNEALREALCGSDEGEVPVGAVVVQDGRVIGRGHNRTEALNDPTAHAEIIALGAAGAAVDSWRMPDATLYVTLEPCMMCAGAILISRIGRLVFAVRDADNGACGSKYDLLGEARLSGRLVVAEGIMGDEGRRLLQEFFATLRTKSSGLSKRF
jgi:tRNA(adenine34) deaminase